MTLSELQADIDAIRTLIQVDLNSFDALKPYANEYQFDFIEHQKSTANILKSRLYLHELFINGNIESADAYRP